MRGREPLSLDDLWVYSLGNQRGAYFPDLHWDWNWAMYPGAAGFNLWCMVEEAQPEALGQGNMFLAHTPHMLPTDPPIQWRFSGDHKGGYTEFEHKGIPDQTGVRRFPLRGHETYRDTQLSWRYLNMTPGECLVFSKRTLHMSDPRPHLSGRVPVGQLRRLAMNVRVAIRPKRAAKSMPVWLGHTDVGSRLEHRQWMNGWVVGGGEPAGGHTRLIIQSRYDWVLGLPHGPPLNGQVWNRHLNVTARVKAANAEWNF